MDRNRIRELIEAMDLPEYEYSHNQGDFAWYRPTMGIRTRTTPWSDTQYYVHDRDASERVLTCTIVN